MTSARGAEDVPGRPEHPGIDAWVLCREFVERIVSDAQASAARDNPGHPVPEVDWEPIWRAGDGASSDESAIGRIIRAASAVAHEICPRITGSEMALELCDRLAPGPDRVGGEVGPETAATRQPPAGDQPVTLVGPAPAPMEPVTTVAEPVTLRRGGRHCPSGARDPGRLEPGTATRRTGCHRRNL